MLSSHNNIENQLAISRIRGLDIPFVHSEHPFLSIVHAIIELDKFRNLRMYGHYTRKRNQRKNIIEQIGIGDEIFKMYPVDHTAELFQQLFASPVGLVVRKSDERLAKYFMPKTIGKILAIVHAKGFYDKENEIVIVGDIVTNKAIWSLVDAALPEDKDGIFVRKKIQRSSEWNTNKHDKKVAFKPAINNILKFLEPRMRLLFEAFKENTHGKGKALGYPLYVVEKLLLIYMWELYQDNKQELEPYYIELLKAGIIKKEFLEMVKFSGEESLYSVKDFLLGNACTPLESMALKKYGYLYFMDTVSPVIQFGMSNIIEDCGQSVDYSDCGDSSLRNLLMMFLFDGHKFNTDRLRLLQKYGFNVSKAMIYYFEEICPTPAYVNAYITRVLWSKVVNRLNKADDQYKVEYVAPTPPEVAKENYIDGYYGINTGLRNILMVLIKLFGEPKCKDSNEYFFSMEMKTRLECIQNIDKICYLMSDTDLTKIYPAYEPVANSDSWSVTVFDYINETNLDFERLQEPTPKDGWTGLTLTFTQKGTEFEWHIDPRHYDFNRKETAYVDKSKISTIDDIYSLKMDSAQEKIEALDCILCYVKTNDSYVFNELLQNWLHSNSNYFAGWKNPKLNLRLIEVLLKYWAIDEVLNAGVPELYDALVWVLVRDYRFKEAMHVLDVDAANAVKSPDSVNFPKQNNARALSQTIKFCSDEQLLKLSDLGVNEYCHMVLGTTLLHLAAGAGNINLSSSLSKLGIDIDTVDSEGKTAIHRAIDSNCTVTVLNLLNQNASIPRFNYIDLLKYITTEAYHEIIQFDGPVHPITSAGGEAAHQEKKHKISSKIQFVKGIETSKWSAAKEIQYILSKFKFNFINIYHDNALLLQCINGNLQTDNFYELAFKNDFFIQLCNVLRNKCFEQNLVGESNSYTSLYQPAIDKDIRHLDFPALVLPEIFNLSKDPIHQMFLIFLYDAEAGKINISKLSALAANGFNINSDLLAHFKKIAEDKEYLNSQRAQSEWRSLLSRVNDGNKFKIRYLADGTMAPGIKNLLRAFASLLGNSLHLDMAMQTKHACLKNINSLCHFFSENELGEWNPNTFNKYWTVNIANYGFADDQDACSLLETLSEDQDWTDISFVFSYGSMSKNRSSIFELNVNQNGYSISATPIALRLNRLDNASREAVQEFLKPHSHDFYQWRNQYINLLVVKTLLKSYTMHQILSFNVPFLYEALLWEAIKTKNAADVKLILTRDAQLESNQPKSLSFSALAKVLAYTLRHADSDDLQLLLKSGASEYATRVTGASLLHLISASGNAPLLKAMLATCDDVNIKDSDGRTALHYATASRLNSSSMISILLENGANINAVDNNLESPLFIVADQIRNEVARILIASTLFLFRDPFCDLPGFDISLFGLFIKAGAYFDINYRKGQSFFDFAIKYCNQSVVNLMHEQLEAALANPQNEIKSLFEPSPADKYHPGDVLTVISFTGCGPKGFIGATEMACHYLHNNREWCRPHIKGNTIYGFYGNVLPMFKDMQEDIRHMFPDIAKYSDEEFDKEARKRHFKDEKTTAAFLKLLEERFGAFVIVRPKIKSSQQIIAETQERQLKHFFTLFKPEAKITCVTAVIDGDSEVEFLVDNHPHLK